MKKKGRSHRPIGTTVTYYTYADEKVYAFKTYLSVQMSVIRNRKKNMNSIKNTIQNIDFVIILNKQWYSFNKTNKFKNSIFFYFLKVIEFFSLEKNIIFVT